MKAVAPERRLDPVLLRKDFPILERMIHGKPLAYLDNTATTQKPVQVLRSLETYYRTYNANVHRGVYQIAEEATAAYEAAREKVARFVGASAREIVFTRGTTESINLVSNAWGRANLAPGDVIVSSEMEHHSNLVPWQIIAAEKGATVRYLPVDPSGRLDLSGFDAILSEGSVKIVAVTHMSNALGTINPVEEIIRKAHAAGALVLLDGAQSVPHLDVDVRALDCDFLAFSGHKMLAPTGIGALYAKRALLESMPPMFGGGEMIREVTLEGSTWNDVPFKFEAGTMNIADAIAFGVAIEYLEAIGMDAVRSHDVELTTLAMTALRNIPQVTVYGPPVEERGGIVSFTVDGIHAHDLAAVLDREGVAVRAGHHCTMPLHTKFGIAASTRASFYVYNVPEEIDRLAAGVRKAIQYYRR